MHTPRNIAYDRRSCAPNTVYGHRCTATGKVLRGWVWFVLLLLLGFREHTGGFPSRECADLVAPETRSCTINIIILAIYIYIDITRVGNMIDSTSADCCVFAKDSLTVEGYMVSSPTVHQRTNSQIKVSIHYPINCYSIFII